MIFAMSIDDEAYHFTRSLEARNHTDRMWGIDPEPVGDKWIIQKHGLLLAISSSVVAGKRTATINGAFKRHDTRQVRGGADAVVDLCRTLGHQHIMLDCYAPVAHAWRRAGFVEYAIECWDDAKAPAVWVPEFGRPSVVYMQHYLGN